MGLFKKLVFSIPLEFSLLGLFWQLSYFLTSPNLVLGFGLEPLTHLVYLTFLILLASLFLVIFLTLANDWKIVLPIALVNSVTPLALIQTSEGLILAGGLFLITVFIFALLRRELSTYLTFNSSQLLVPETKRAATFLAFLIAATFYFSAAVQVKQNGFTLPDSLVDQVLRISPILSASSDKDSLGQSLLSPQQLELLKQNPQALKAAGLDPSVLESLTNANSNPNMAADAVVKKALENQFQTVIKSVIDYIPIFLAVMFFISITSLGAIISIILPPTVWLIFFVLEKTGFIQFSKEMREVKKLVV